MSRQINLLPKPPQRALLSALNAAIILLIWCIALGLLTWSGSRDLDAARSAADNSAREQKSQQHLLRALQKKLGDSDNPHNLSAQIAALASQTRVSKDLLERLKNGELGSLDGYGEQLTELARVPQRGVWITLVTITHAGRSLRVEGHALRKEQILPYAATLNRTMVTYGIVLKDIEITPMQQNADADQPLAPVWTFKLY
jgi:hypothetical protein